MVVHFFSLAKRCRVSFPTYRSSQGSDAGGLDVARLKVWLKISRLLCSVVREVTSDRREKNTKEACTLDDDIIRLEIYDAYQMCEKVC